MVQAIITALFLLTIMPEMDEIIDILVTGNAVFIGMGIALFFVYVGYFFFCSNLTPLVGRGRC